MIDHDADACREPACPICQASAVCLLYSAVMQFLKDASEIQRHSFANTLLATVADKPKESTVSVMVRGLASAIKQGPSDA